MEREVAWAGARSDLGEWRVVRRERALGGVELVDEYLIEFLKSVANMKRFRAWAD